MEITQPGGSGELEVGITNIVGGTNGYFLYDNNGVLGEINAFGTYVPYTGATADLDMGAHSFKTTANFDLYANNSKVRFGSAQQGSIYYNGSILIIESSTGVALGNGTHSISKLLFNTVTTPGNISYIGGSTNTFDFTNNDNNSIIVPKLSIEETTSGNYYLNTFQGSTTQTGNHTYTTPDASGTLALQGLAGTKTYYVSDTSGGATNRKLTFINGILTSES